VILLIDNYDSFTYNLYQLMGELYPNIKVRRNDAVTIAEIEEMNPQAIIISPGPGYPKDAGISNEAIKYFAGKIPILGVCLGFQGIVEVMGGEIVHAKSLMHGKVSEIKIDTRDALFKNLPEKIEAARYHSLAAKADLPANLKVTAQAPDGEVMAVSHIEHKLYGVQFHPESVMTSCGRVILRNFLEDAGVENLKPLPAADTNAPDAEALKPYISKIITAENLSEDEAKAAMDSIMGGNATNAQIGSFLTAMRMKGETVEEITGFAKSMRGKASHMAKLTDTVDIVGTGGDLAHTFNISTTSVFVAAACGARVSKHGNRSVSSLSGSADVLEALGVKINMPPEEALRCLDETGMCFMFAPVFHSSMRYAGAPRKEIGVRSVFNILGPLANPAGAEYMLLGVYDKNLIEPMALVLKNLGIKKALVIHGEDGLDEVTVTGKTEICEVERNKIIKYSIHPSDFGLDVYNSPELTGGSAQENAKILKNVLLGERGAKRDIVILNSAAALFALGKCFDINHGVKIAANAIDSGKAYEKLEKLIEFTNK
jgi:anthranilate synthase/phosphoribosyltransferase